jgi:endonuclease G
LAFNTKYFPELDFQVKCDKVLKKSFGNICYSCKEKKPMIVEYDIFGYMVKLPRYNRGNLYFRPEYSLPRKCRSYPNDYTHLGYDRGHNASNATFAFNRKLQKETFLMSNIAPQAKWLNRKYWAKLEKFSRYMAIKYGEIEVATGSCGIKGYLRNGVVIPEYWFKILYIPKIDKYLAFLVPNINKGMKKAKIKDYMVDLKEIEEKCGFKIKKTNMHQEKFVKEMIFNSYLGRK